MTLQRLIREIAYPATNGTLLMGMLVFYLLGQLAAAAGFFGIWLAIVILPAYFRFLINVLESRSAGRDAEPPSIEMFSWVSGGWTLMPLAIALAIGWGFAATWRTFGEFPATVLGIVLLTLYPASMGVLAVTHSALASINPLNIANMIRMCGPAYPMVPLTVGALAFVLYLAAAAGVPSLIVEIGEVYLFFLLFSLTGAVVGQTEAAQQIDIPDAVEPDSEVVDALEEKARTRVLDHAYGMVSRGNRDGGLAHIGTFIQQAPAPGLEYQWFFQEMLRWEGTDPALLLGQRYLRWLLDADEHAAALKLLSRCYAENPRFRPLPEDRPRALELAEAHGRDDLIAALRR